MRTLAATPKVSQLVSCARSSVQAPPHFGQTDRVNSILRVQDGYDKRVRNEMANDYGEATNVPLSRTTSPFGYEFNRIAIHPNTPRSVQSKLTINEPGDQYEEEADRVAEQVMRMQSPSVPHTAQP